MFVIRNNLLLVFHVLLYCSIRSENRVYNVVIQLVVKYLLIYCHIFYRHILYNYFLCFMNDLNPSVSQHLRLLYHDMTSFLEKQ